MLDFSEVRVLDRNAEHLGVPISTLMESAGEAVAEVLRDNFDIRRERVLLICGKGNNGGDGFVAARHLSHDTEVKVLIAEPENQIQSELARDNLEHVRKLASVIGGVEDVAREMTAFTLIVDAMLGVGVKGNVREPYASIIHLINSSGKKVVSVDVPSGLGCDVTVHPDITVTFHARKAGMTEANSGKIIVSDIGIPPEAEAYTGPGDLVYYSPSMPSSHKGENGRLLVVGGGPYTGAPALVAMGAMAVGADLVRLAVPRPVSQVVAGFSPNFIVYPIGKAKEGSFTAVHIEQIALLAEQCDAVVIGPGCGSNPETLNALVELAGKLKLPMVIDADGLSAVARDLAKIKDKEVVLTPHQGEFKRMFHAELPDDLAERAAVVKKFAGSIGATILLKGEVDIVSDGNVSKENHTGNPGMTSGGTGDVLAGAVGGLMARGAKPYQAARMAAFLVGAAGDLAFEELSYGLTATDVIAYIPTILRRYL